MNTIVNITGITSKCLKISEENAIKKIKKKEYFRKYYLNNKKHIKKYTKNWVLNNADKVKNYKQTWNLNNKKHKAEWFQKNKKRILKERSLRLKKDLNFKMKHQLGTRIRKVLNGVIKKSKSTNELVGCTIEQLWIHLEKSFKPGMTKENYGKWHVDHIRPCASFDLSKPEEQAKCFHYTNLQALWAYENISKGAKY
jgi:hypothetical protein